MKKKITREQFAKQDFVSIIEGVKSGWGTQKIANKLGRASSSVSTKITQFGGRGVILDRLFAGESPEVIASYWWKKMGYDTLPERRADHAIKMRESSNGSLSRIEAKLDRLLELWEAK